MDSHVFEPTGFLGMFKWGKIIYHLRLCVDMDKIDLGTAKLELCDHCLGRIYALLGHGLTNEERGRSIRILYAMESEEEIDKLYPERCSLCGNIFDKLEDYARYISNTIKDLEFDTFMIGSRFPKEVIDREKNLQERYGNLGEPINREFNRELGKKLMDILGKEATIKEPDITIVVDTEYDDLEIEIKPLLIYGRYRKLVRGIPQTKWPSGKYKESVEEIIAKPFMEITQGEGHALHGMGREDIDALMLGNGRPFILEIKRPKKRKIDLNYIAKIINSSGKVEVLDLKLAEKKDIERLKSAEPKKRYRVGIEVQAKEEEIKEALKTLIGKISQRTPTRVKHRRADKIRIKEVYEAKLVGKKGNEWVIEILAQSGTYIKELMHGDGGRTKPSLAEKLGKDVKVLWLDVIEILDELNR